MRARILKLRQPWEVFEFTNSNCWLYGCSFKKAPCYFISFIKRPLLEPHLHTFIRALSITSMPKIYYGNGVHCEDDEMMGIFELWACAMFSSLLKRITWRVWPGSMAVFTILQNAGIYRYLFISLWFLDEHSALRFLWFTALSLVNF